MTQKQTNVFKKITENLVFERSKFICEKFPNNPVKKNFTAFLSLLLLLFKFLCEAGRRRKTFEPRRKNNEKDNKHLRKNNEK